jgi:hypothetical protein
MANYLTKTVETYRVSNEKEAKALIEEAKNDKNYTLTKYTSEYRSAKAKGEIVDEWFRVTLTKTFNEEKEPYCSVNVEYKIDEGFFPSVAEDADED